MSDVSRPRGADSCELEPVTCWPLIFGAGGFLLLGAVAAITLFAYDCLRSPEKVAKAAPPQPKEVEQHAAAIDRGPEPPAVAPAVPPRSPARRVVVNEYVPLPPAAREPQDYAGSPRLTPKVKKPQKVKPTKSQDMGPPNREEDQLAELLQKQALELDVDSEKGAAKKLLAVATSHAEQVKKKRDEKADSVSASTPLEALLTSRKDLKGLPLLLGKACETDVGQALVLGKVSREFRPLQAAAQAKAKKARASSESLSHVERLAAARLGYVDAGLKAYLSKSFQAVKEPALLVRPWEQTYQTEAAGMRLELVSALAGVDGKEATQALARRAVFDLSPEVRKAAVEAIQKRKYADAREVFVSAFRHPWAPAADHAALALVALEDEKAVDELVKMLNLPDPATPVKQDGEWTTKQLVRVNHLRNCVLCHAPSTDVKDSVRAPIPTPGEALPVVYYSSRSRGPSVRADVVYFRQDFSAMHAVEKPNKWPAVQRFDYLVQSRELKAGEAEELTKRLAGQKTYPQREALRWAVAMLRRELAPID